jgi:hypothetical protein
MISLLHFLRTLPITPPEVLALVWVHLFSDFFLQTDKMATQKSKSNKWLSIHCAVYSIPFLLFGPVYALVNGLAHLMTDYITSRITSIFWKKEERHWFFATIGVDQAIHISTLVLTFGLARGLASL